MSLAKQRIASIAATLLVAVGAAGDWVQVTTITGHVDRFAGWDHGSVWALAGCALAAAALWFDGKRTALVLAALTSVYLIVNANQLPGQLSSDLAGYAYMTAMSWGAYTAWIGSALLVAAALVGLVQDQRRPS